MFCVSRFPWMVEMFHTMHLIGNVQRPLLCICICICTYWFSCYCKFKKLLRAPRTSKVSKKSNPESAPRTQILREANSKLTPSCFSKILLFLSFFLRSYLTSGQCYQGIIFLVAPPFSLMQQLRDGYISLHS